MPLSINCFATQIFHFMDCLTAWPDWHRCGRAWGSLGQIEIGAGLSGTGKLAVNLLLLLGAASFLAG